MGLETTEIIGLAIASIVALIAVGGKWVKATPSTKDDEVFEKYVSPLSKLLESIGKALGSKKDGGSDSSDGPKTP